MRRHLVSAVFVVLGAGWQACHADQVVCSADGAGKDTCDIFVPNVLDPVTSLPGVQFQAGDRVVVTASGCAQTGGFGKTWKDYVNPQGPKSDDHYHGLISIPGSTAGMVRLSSVVGINLPPSTGGSLSIGYEDDGFGDNGYWSPDNGTDDQCANSSAGEAGFAGKAQIHLVIQRAGAIPAAPSTYGQCTSTSPGVDQCRIDRPDVTLQEEPYSSVLFRPGDTVSVTAGGCVQTGGFAKTWKRYVDPSGPKAEDVMDGATLIRGLYHGLISIPGTTNGMVRLSTVVGRALPPSTGGPLVLGYEDEFGGYLDNGYWSHDDGTDDQCKDVGPAFVTLEITRAAVPSTGHINVDGLEVVQAIQNVNQSIPLVANKVTFVRAYVSSAMPIAPTLTGVLRVTPTSGPAVTVLSGSPLPTRNDETLRQRREAWSRSLNFLLPNSVTVEGQIQLRLDSLTDVTTSLAVSCNGCAPGPTVTFATSPILRVTAIGLIYTSAKGTFSPSVKDLELLGSWLGRAYPTEAPEYGTRTVVANDSWPFDCDAANAQVGAIRANDMANGDNPRIHYYGMVSDGDGFMRGCAQDVPAVPSPGVIASGPTGAPATSGLPGIFSLTGVLLDTDGSYGDWYGGHEIGHTLGRSHPGFCADNSAEDPNYPFPNGQISDNQGSYVGLDVGDVVHMLPTKALPGTSTFDVMTYCMPLWLSAYNYQAVRQRLIDEDSQFEGPQDRGSGTGPDAQASSGSSRSRGFGNGSARASAKAVTANGLVHVIALLDLSTKKGKFRYMTPVARGVPPHKGKNSVLIRTKDAGNRTVRQFVAEYTFSTDKRPRDHKTATVDTTIQIDSRVVSVELVEGATLLDTFRAGPAPPTAPQRVRIARTPQRGNLPAGFVLTWNRSANRARESITYTVEMDDAGLWRTIAIGTVTNSLRLTEEQATKPRLRVTATNGLYNSERVAISGI